MGKLVHKLNDLQIQSFIRAGQPVAVADGNGLTFTMSAKQAARKSGSWTLRYRIGGRQRELTLGNYPEMSLAEARDEAEGKRGQIKKGDDVARAKQEQKVEQAAAQTVRQLATDYIDRRFAELAPSTQTQRRDIDEAVDEYMPSGDSPRQLDLLG